MTYRRAVLPVALAGLVLGLGSPAAHAAPSGWSAASIAARTASAAKAAAQTTAGHAAAAPAATAKVAGSLVAQYSFDGGRAGSVIDESGHGHTLSLVSAAGGTVRSVAHRNGQAVKFPAKCTNAKATCPHAALRSPSTALLNPGTRSLAFGASVLLAPSQTTKGQNIVQKGYSTASSQWKMQVDGKAGKPSCVLVGANPGIKIVRSDVSVADGHWHTIECRRQGTTFSVLVDGVVRGTRTVSAKLSIANQRPLSVGGKGAYSDNDQFQGILDDVWVRVG
ncbi:LamG-like jellyroll fold domain-containing protein [Actinoplanes sp. TFC3]|uniref:LamG-like jellyroll fold domain-containing protein n=1 Tax=Actinoplanes sp. TFC3 TaxID=1710355 RepID=UPI0009E926F7|nr:LamG-like jellyroll fold domain-containing protein [Actinoplanes sp. TFC3]